MSNFFPKLGSALALCVVVSALSARAVTVTSVSGVVSDSHGSPQVGALVELMRGDSSVVASVFTDGRGRYTLSHIQPGVYSLKAVGSAFLPSLRKNLAIKSRTVVNMTLTTIFEAAQWLPAQKRSKDEAEDDWTWTLRSSSNRPLLRMLEDGPLVLVADGGAKAAQPVRVRFSTTTNSRQFGKGGLHNTVDVGHASTDDKRSIVFHGDASQSGTPAFQAAIGYRQDLTPDHTLRTVVAISDHPQIRGTDSQTRLSTLVMRSSQVLQLMENLEAEAGGELDAIRSDRGRIENHPFAGVSWKSGHQKVGYRFATLKDFRRAQDAAAGDSGLLPQVAEHHGSLSIEHGLHQEISVTRETDKAEVGVVLYRDHVNDPVVNGGGAPLSVQTLNSGDVLYDSVNDIFRIAGQDYVSTGFLIDAKYQLPGNTWIAFDMADGNALTFTADDSVLSLGQAIEKLHTRRAQMYTLAVNGKVSSTGTRWQASYRWQPDDTVTAVAAFNGNTSSPYLRVYVRQPLRCIHMLPAGLEAQIDMRNLLGEGYRPFKNVDGGTLYFAQAERSIQGGLSFTF